MMKKKVKIIRILFVCLVLIITTCAVYINDYYKADQQAIEVFAVQEDIALLELNNSTLAFIPEEPKAGLIFYPGGKVEYTSYVPLMKVLATKGIQTILVEMPFNLAVFDIDAASGIQEQYPNIETWYIGGHSLGGSMAASYLLDNVDDYEGLILLGSYAIADLSQTDLHVLSIYGSEDRVLNRDNYNESISNLPLTYQEIIIEGGCHAYFGMYGAQEGDGMPTISNIEQINMTADIITEFVNNN